NIEHHLEANMDVRVGDAARRDRRDVHRELLRADVLPRQPDLVVDAVPVATVLAAADDENAVVPFDRRLEIGHFSCLTRKSSSIAPTVATTSWPTSPAEYKPRMPNTNPPIIDHALTGFGSTGVGFSNQISISYAVFCLTNKKQ